MTSSESRPVIAVDAMGGDHGPSVVVAGAVEALRREDGCDLALYGDPSAIEEQLSGLDAVGLPVEVVPCSQDISMSESPASAIRGKPDSPIVRAMQDQKAGKVQAVVSAGSTGAMVAASLIILGRLPSVSRPAIATLIPTVKSHLLLLDVGANTQCTPEHLATFAAMGDLYAREMLDLQEPRIGLLNIGEEASKGTELTQAAHALMKDGDYGFVGNIESNSLLFDRADVVVTDGFTGNMVLKLVEGIGRFLKGVMAGSGMLEGDAQGAASSLKQLFAEKLSYESYGGALLLGIDGVSIISHGRSSSRAIASAVRSARRQVQLDIPVRLQDRLAPQS